MFFFLFIFDKVCSTSYFFYQYCNTMHGFHVSYFVEIVCHCLVSIEFLLCRSVFVILHNPQSIPFPLYMPSTKFQSLHILAVLDQRSIYARTYFSLQVFLKLVTFCTFQTLAQAVIMNLVLSNVIITAFK